MLQVFHEQAPEVGAREVIPSGAAVPTRTGSEAGAIAPTCMRSSKRMRIAAGGGAEPACACDNSSSTQVGAAASGQAGGQELHALFFDLLVITRSNSSPANLL
jgi:hypothetical protein